MKRWRRRRRGELFLYISLTTVGMCKKPPLAFLEIGMDRVAQSGFSSLSLRESRICDERAGGSEFSILRGCLLEHLGRFRLLFSLLARIGNLWRGGRTVQNSRFSGIVSSGALWTLLHSPCENRGSVDRGLGGAELMILREDFSGEGGTSFLSFKSLFSHSLN